MMETSSVGNVVLSGARQSQRSRGFLYELRRNWSLYLMLAIPFIGFAIFRYAPLFGEVMAFQDYDIIDGFWGSEWVGLENFIKFFNDRYFFRLVRNTILLNACIILFGFPAPIIFALMLDQVRQRHALFKRVCQSLSYLPHFIATVVIVGLIYDFFAGEAIVNQMISALGMEKVRFLSDPAWFRPLYVGSDIWQETGWGAIVYLAALSGIDESLYEAAAIDGAGRWRQVIHVTLPGILPTVRTLFILQMGRLVTVGFEKAYLLQQPGTYETSDVIVTYVYRRGITGLDFSYATAVGLVNSVVAVLLVVAAHFVAKKVSGEGLW